MKLSLSKLVRTSLAIHNLNKAAEQTLGLSLVQYHVLAALLDLPGCTPAELACASGMHPSTLTQTLKILSRKHLVFIDKHPKDSRKKILLATREGRDIRLDFELGIERVLEGLNPEHRHWMVTLGPSRHSPKNPGSGSPKSASWGDCPAAATGEKLRR